LIAVVAILAAVVGAWWLYTHTVDWTWGCGGRADFSALPPDDAALEGWLKEQAGVVPYTVHVMREGKTLKVLYTQVRNLANEPPRLDLNEACKNFGYEGQKMPFAPYYD
jgi:hypothetical protein